MRAFDRLRTPPGLVAAIDIGTAKICCLIAAPDAEGTFSLLGFGHHKSLGVKSGVIVDSAEAERALRAAVSQAERMAGVTLEKVVVAVSCGRLKSSTLVAKAAVAGPVVGPADIDRVIAGGEAYIERGARGIVQLTRSDWRLDDVKGVRDPRGLAGRELSVELTAVTADEAPVRNLLSVVERCHLSAGGLAASPFASAVAVATSEERRSQVLVVDIGAGVTSLALFAGGRLIYADALTVGGHLVTFDIARQLTTPVAEAERIKTLYGTLVKAASDESEMISFPVAGEDEAVMFQVSKARVREIIEPRIAMLFSQVEERLQAAGLGGAAQGRVILTGGGSQLLGLDQAWVNRFGGVPRIGRPKPIGRMPMGMATPAFATLIGLALGESSQDSGSAGAGTGRRQGGEGRSYFGRVKQWVNDSF